MPEIRKPVEPLCCYCRHFHVHVTGGENGNRGPYCGFWDKYFPNPRGFLDGDGSRPPGERSCDNWESMYG